VTFEILDHPADIGFRARGASLAELFANCAHALIALILEPADIRPAEQLALTAEGTDYESLLVNWLNEVLYYVDGRRLALSRFDITHLSQTRIDCTAWGEPRDAARHPAKLVVKAVTYHQLTVRQDENGCVADVYVDV
jgi:SHS2 domain-containing protein